MPALFTPLPTFVWSRAPAKPKQPNRRDACRCQRSRRPLNPSACELLIDRLEAASHDGRLEYDAAGYARLLAILFPESFPPERPPPPTATAPGSAERVAEYARRQAAGRALFHAGDAEPVDDDRRALAIRMRLNGRGVQVLGWAGDGDA